MLLFSLLLLKYGGPLDEKTHHLLPKRNLLIFITSIKDNLRDTLKSLPAATGIWPPSVPFQRNTTPQPLTTYDPT